MQQAEKGPACTYRIGDEVLFSPTPTLRIADQVVTPEIVPKARPQRMPKRAAPRDEADELLRSTCRVQDMQHECIARALETTQKTHEMINQLNNSFANERISLFKMRQIEARAEAPGGTDLVVGLARMLFDRFSKKKG